MDRGGSNWNHWFIWQAQWSPNILRSHNRMESEIYWMVYSKALTVYFHAIELVQGVLNAQPQILSVKYVVHFFVDIFLKRHCTCELSKIRCHFSMLSSWNVLGLTVLTPLIFLRHEIVAKKDLFRHFLTQWRTPLHLPYAVKNIITILAYQQYAFTPYPCIGEEITRAEKKIPRLYEKHVCFDHSK